MRQKIKILIHHRSMEMGGVENLIIRHLENIDLEKFEVTLLLNLHQGPLRNSIPKNIQLIYLCKGREDLSKHKIIHRLQLVFRRIKLFFLSKFSSFIYKFYLKNRFDIIISPTYTTFASVLNYWDKNSIKVGWFHTDVSYDKNKKRVLKRIKWLKSFDWVIFGSKQTREVITELYQVNFPKSNVIYNPVNARTILKLAEEKVNLPIKQKPTFVSVGRLHARKGFDMLANIHRKLLDDGLIHQVWIIGDGPERAKLEQKIVDLQIQDSFLLLGTQKNPYPFMNASDFFILPSRSESYPLIIPEAMALGIPLISTNVGGIPEAVIHNKNGYLINPNEEEIYQAMKLFLTDNSISNNIKEELLASKIYQTDEAIYQEFENLMLKLANN